jgi:hypothetical protein
MGKAMSALGNICAGSTLLFGDLLVTIIRGTCQGLANLIDWVSGSGKDTSRNKRPWHSQKYMTAPVYKESGMNWGELDVDATMSKSAFPLKPEKLLEKAKEVLGCEFGTAPGADHSVLADDFQFVAPIVGPLDKDEFMGAFGSFKVKDAISDIKDNSWFQVDPLEPNRVWFFSRATGTHDGPLNFGRPIAATGKQIRMPPQAQSMLFNEKGQCYTLTVGYTMDKRIGNTDGLGGLFGILKAVGHGLPFPEGQRLYNPSMRYEAFERLAKVGEAFGFGPAAQGKKMRASD